MLDPAALMRLRTLEMRARVVVEGYWKGIHRSPYHGFSVEFSEYRPYVPGDDPRFIDWKVLARSDRVFLKKFEDETNLRCTLVVDQSRSMSFAAAGHSKADYASTLAATLGQFLMEQGDAVGLATFDEKLDQWIPPRNRPGHLRRLMVHLDNAPRGNGTDFTGPLENFAGQERRRGLLVLISDLLSPVENLLTTLGHLTALGHDLMVFQVLDRAELDFTFDRATHFRDAESGEEIYVDPGAARESYLSKLRAHLDAVRHACESRRADYRLVATDEPMEQVLYDFVKGREKAKPRARRSRSSPR